MKARVPANKPHYTFIFILVMVAMIISATLVKKFKQQQLCGRLTIGLSRNGQCKTQTVDCRLQTADKG